MNSFQRQKWSWSQTHDQLVDFIDSGNARDWREEEMYVVLLDMAGRLRAALAGQTYEPWKHQETTVETP
jgi:hypothetical protein